MRTKKNILILVFALIVVLWAVGISALLLSQLSKTSSSSEIVYGKEETYEPSHFNKLIE